MGKITWFIIIIFVGGGLFGWYYTSRFSSDVVSRSLEITNNIDHTTIIEEDICVINVVIPQFADIIGASFDVSGEASNCLDGGGVLVYDDMGQILSVSAIIMDGVREEDRGLFLVHQELRFQPKTKTGYIEVFSADEIVRQRVSIQFEENLEIVD